MLDLRISDFNLDGLTSLSADEIVGTIVIQLGPYEPVSYSFKSLPLPAESSGVLCMLKSFDPKVGIPGPCAVTVLAPMQSYGYSCIARGIQTNLTPLGKAHFLHALRSKPSRSVKSAKVVHQLISSIDLHHARGCTTKAGSIEIIARVILLHDVDPLLDAANAATVLENIPRPTSAAFFTNEIPDRSLVSSVEFTRDSVRAIKHQVQRLSRGSTFSLPVRESMRSSVSVQLQRIRDRWRNPSDINYRAENHRDPNSVSVEAARTSLARPLSAPVPKRGQPPSSSSVEERTTTQDVKRTQNATIASNNKGKYRRENAVINTAKGGKVRSLSEKKSVQLQKKVVKIVKAPIPNKTNSALKEAIEKLHHSLVPKIEVLFKQSEAIERGLNFLPMHENSGVFENIGSASSLESIQTISLHKQQLRQKESSNDSTLFEDSEFCLANPPTLLFTKT